MTKQMRIITASGVAIFKNLNSKETKQAVNKYFARLQAANERAFITFELIKS